MNLCKYRTGARLAGREKRAETSADKRISPSERVRILSAQGTYYTRGVQSVEWVRSCSRELLQWLFLRGLATLHVCARKHWQ